jgi:hypothetical protein
MSEPYHRRRTFYQDISSKLFVAAATTTSTLVTGKTPDTIYIQKIHIEVTAGSAGKTWSIQDNNGAAVTIIPPVDVSAVAHYDFDAGPEGIPITEGKNLVLTISAAGAAGWVSWEGYSKRTAVTNT